MLFEEGANDYFFNLQDTRRKRKTLRERERGMKAKLKEC